MLLWPMLECMYARASALPTAMSKRANRGICIFRPAPWSTVWRLPLGMNSKTNLGTSVSRQHPTRRRRLSCWIEDWLVISRTTSSLLRSSSRGLKRFTATSCFSSVIPLYTPPKQPFPSILL
ncbi:Os11g0690154 [Oryza sativa Japonica Group]|uniref:Os11g0690154 protein n=1 Tax=Oryza sativa subsp. japonica TaxID=39947 RepID=A0A0N7KTD4_ORYSJ|nr:Os11g0690154 [Oryza sativa Japonica Group]